MEDDKNSAPLFEPPKDFEVKNPPAQTEQPREPQQQTPPTPAQPQQPQTVTQTTAITTTTTSTEKAPDVALNPLNAPDEKKDHPIIEEALNPKKMKKRLLILASILGGILIIAGAAITFLIITYMPKEQPEEEVAEEKPKFIFPTKQENLASLYNKDYPVPAETPQRGCIGYISSQNGVFVHEHDYVDCGPFENDRAMVIESDESVVSPTKTLLLNEKFETVAKGIRLMRSGTGTFVVMNLTDNPINETDDVYKEYKYELIDKNGANMLPKNYEGVRTSFTESEILFPQSEHMPNQHTPEDATLYVLARNKSENNILIVDEEGNYGAAISVKTTEKDPDFDFYATRSGDNQDYCYIEDRWSEIQGVYNCKTGEEVKDLSKTLTTGASTSSANGIFTQTYGTEGTYIYAYNNNASVHKTKPTLIISGAIKLKAGETVSYYNPISQQETPEINVEKLEQFDQLNPAPKATDEGYYRQSIVNDKISYIANTPDKVTHLYLNNKEVKLPDTHTESENKYAGDLTYSFLRSDKNYVYQKTGKFYRQVKNKSLEADEVIDMVTGKVLVANKEKAPMASKDSFVLKQVDKTCKIYEMLADYSFEIPECDKIDLFPNYINVTSGDKIQIYNREGKKIYENTGL